MTDEPALIRRPLDHCPACSNAHLEPVVDLYAEAVHFLCRTCNRCWHVELGYVRRVPPNACEGCPQRDSCLLVYRTDHPSA